MRSPQQVLKEISTPESGKKRYRDSMAKLLTMHSPFAIESIHEQAKRSRQAHHAARNLIGDFNSIASEEVTGSSTEHLVADRVTMRRG